MIENIVPDKLSVRDRLSVALAPPAELSRARIRSARLLALAADALQLFLFPLFGEGFLSPADDALDAAMALALTKLIGFHWSYLPSAIAELVPGLDLAPTWTAAALLATHGKGQPATDRVRRWPLFIGAVSLAALAAIALYLWNRR